MKRLTLARTVGIIAMLAASGSVSAEETMQSAMNNCREEAMSTGLEDESAISAYMDIYMQAWQSPPEYIEEAPPIEEAGDPPMETAESMAQ